MKRWKTWLPILPIIVAIIAISGGSFAYTTLTGTSTVGITGGGTEFATVTEAGYNWTPKPTGSLVGSVPAGELFSIARDSDYTGDLVFTLALTNLDDLIAKFVTLNLEIQVMDGATPSAEVTTEWLTLEEPVVELVVPAAKTSPFTVNISDGSYRAQKGTDPTVSPLFHLRATQK